MFKRVEIPFIGFEDVEIRRVIECAAFEASAPIDAPETVRAVTAPVVRSAVARIWAVFSVSSGTGTYAGNFLLR